MPVLLPLIPMIAAAAPAIATTAAIVVPVACTIASGVMTQKQIDNANGLNEDAKKQEVRQMFANITQTGLQRKASQTREWMID